MANTIDALCKVAFPCNVLRLHVVDHISVEIYRMLEHESPAQRHLGTLNLTDERACPLSSASRSLPCGFCVYARAVGHGNLCAFTQLARLQRAVLILHLTIDSNCAKQFIEFPRERTRICALGAPIVTWAKTRPVCGAGLATWRQWNVKSISAVLCVVTPSQNWAKALLAEWACSGGNSYMRTG
jgi:hypothetical protein